MRAYMNKLKARGELLEVTREVDPKHELAAVTDAAHKRWGKPILFHNVKGTKLPVLTNTYGSRERLAEIIGIKPDEFCKQWNNLATIASARFDSNRMIPPLGFDRMECRDRPREPARYVETLCEPAMDPLFYAVIRIAALEQI